MRATPTGIRETTLAEFLPIAEAIVDSGPVISIFAACEWDELGDDGKQWVAAIVREAMATYAEERH